VAVVFDDREVQSLHRRGQVNTSIDEFNGDLIDRGPPRFIGAPISTPRRSARTPNQGQEHTLRVRRVGRRMEENAVSPYPPPYRRNMTILDSRILL